MKNFRPLAASLLASALVALASAQQGDDIAGLRAKAEKGNGIAQYNLGLAYAEGRGVPADRLEAYVWLSLARENGARGRAFDTLVSSLDAASLAEAKQRLAQHRATAEIPVVSTRSKTEIADAVATGESAAASSDNASLQGKIATLTADKKQLSEEVAKAWKEIDALNSALLKAQREIRINAQSATAAETASASKFSLELEASLKRTNEQRDALEKKLAAAQAEIASVKAGLAEQSQKNEKLAAAEAARLAPSAEIAAIRDQLGTAQSQVAALTTDLAAVRASETALHDTIAQLEQEKARLAAAPRYPDLSSRVGELQAQLARSHSNLETANEAALAASKQSAIDQSASAAQIARLQNALAARSTAPAYPDLSGKVRELEAAVADSTRKLADATHAQATLTNQLADSSSQIRNSNADAGRIKALEAEAARLTASLAAAKNSAPAYPDLSGKVRELEAKAADASQKLAAATQAQSSLQEQLAASLSAAQAATKAHEGDAQLRRERDDLSSRAAKLAEENDQLRKDRERIQKSLADSSNQARNSAADSARIKTLEAETASLTASLAAAKKQAPAYPDLSGKVRELETQLANTNRQADAAVQTAVASSKQSTADLNAAAAQIAQLKMALAEKDAATSAADLSGRVRELESQLAAAAGEVKTAKQEVASISRARDEALKNRGPVYPNLAGRVVELQTALADKTRELKDAQDALHLAEQAQPAAPAAVAVATEPSANADTSGQEELQKRLDESENKLSSALRGYALLQRELDSKVETATKGAETVATERDSLASQVATLTAEVEQLKSAAAGQTATARGDVARANESLAALQRSSAQNTADLAAARALLQQVQGAYTVLARENYQLKARLSPGGPAETPITATAPMSSPAAARMHTVAAGDTLSKISQRYYGTPSRWQEIYKVNAAKLGTNGILRIGMELVVP